MMEAKNLQLSKKTNEVSFKERFNLVEISDFLGKNAYQQLKNSYPKEDYFSNQTEFAKSLNDKSIEFHTFLQNSNIWNEFIEEINSEIFVNDLIKFFKIKNVYFANNNWRRFIPFYKQVKLHFSFNISKNGGYSLPHTDGSRKLVALVFFFVDKAWTFKNGGYVNLYKPINPLYEDNWRNERVDKKNLEIIKRIIPQENKMYGFKKTVNSYHSVEPVVEINSLDRKVLMINLIYKNINDAPYEKNTLLNKILKKLNIFFKSN